MGHNLRTLPIIPKFSVGVGRNLEHIPTVLRGNRVPLLGAFF